MDRAGEGSGASGTLLVDPGVPYEHDAEPAPKVETPVEKKPSADDDRFKSLESQLADLRKSNAEIRESERRWADIAQRHLNKNESDDEPEPDDLPQPEIKTTPEEDLDEIAKVGLAEVLRKRGYVSRTELNKAVKETEQRATQNIQEARTDATFDNQIATEFPEIAADYQLINAGKQPKSELFQRGSEIYRAAVKLDPSLKASKSALLISIRQAKAELTAEDKGGKDDTDPVEEKPTRQQNRRERIDRQRSDRAPAGGADEGNDDPVLTADQKTVMQRLGVKPEEFLKNAGPRGDRRGH